MPTETYVFKETMAGFNTDLIVSSKPHALLKGLNLDLEKEPGTLRKRKGFSLYGAQIVDNKDLLGLHEFIDSSGNRIPLAVINDAGDSNSKIVYYSSGWQDSDLTNLTAGSTMRFANFIGYCFATNGSEIKSSTNGSAWGTTNLTDARAANDILVYSNVLFNIGINGYESDIIYSNVPSKANWSSAYTLTWSDTNNVTIRLGDGEDLIGGMVYRGGLYLFKNSSLTRTFYPIRDNGVRTISDNIGANSKDCIQVVSGQMIFFCDGLRNAKKGFYSYVSTSDSEPKIISEPMQPYIDGMTAGQTVTATTFGDLYVAYIGAVSDTEYNISMDDCYLVFNAKTNQWLGAWDLGRPAKVMSQITVSNVTSPFMGDDDGKVWKLDDSTTDIDAAISFQGESQIYDISQITGRNSFSKRTIKAIWIIGDSLDGVSFQYRFDKRKSDKDGWYTVQGIKTPVHYIPVKNIKANLWQFRFFGIGSSADNPIIRKVIINYE